MSFHVRLPRNEKGRDFVVGDIHGEVDKLFEALTSVRFDPFVDRLIAVGDLVDRGPQSMAVLRNFAVDNCLFSVRGNHEQMAIDAFRSSNHSTIVHHLANGGAWFHEMSGDQQANAVAIMEAMPIAITIETAYGDVGVVHAQPMADMTWPDFANALEHDYVQNTALWSRGIISRKQAVNIEGVKRVYCGHTPVSEITELGNVTFIDSGACFSLKPLFIVQVSP